MVFAKELRDRVPRGRIRSSVRIWQSPRVKVGNRYPMEDGHIVIDSIDTITRKQIRTTSPARATFKASRPAGAWDTAKA